MASYRSRLAAELRPILACGQAARALVTGSRALLHHGWQWATSSRQRLGCLAAGSLTLFLAYRIHPVPVLSTGLITWAIAAWIHAPTTASRLPPNKPVTDPAEEPDDDTPTEEIHSPNEDRLPGILDHLIGDTRGVHLPAIVNHLHTTGLDTTCTRPDVRAALDRRGIPTRPSVKVDGKVNEGVHREDLDAWLKALPDHIPKEAPQTAPTPATTVLTSDVAKPTTPTTAPPTPQQKDLEKGLTAPAHAPAGA